MKTIPRKNDDLKHLAQGHFGLDSDGRRREIRNRKSEGVTLARADASLSWWVVAVVLISAFLGCGVQDSETLDEPGEISGQKQPASTRDSRFEEEPEFRGTLSTEMPAKLSRMDTLREEAIRVAEQVIDAFPDDPDAIAVMAMVHHRFGDTQSSVEWLEKCLQLDPECADAFHGMGAVALKKGEYEKALSLLSRALEIAPTLVGANDQLAEALVGLGRFEEAVAVLVDHLDTSPASASALVSLGAAYYQWGRFEDARQSYSEAVKLAPDKTDAYYGLARACEKLGEQEESKDALKKFRELRANEYHGRVGRAHSFRNMDHTYQAVADAYTASGEVYLRHDMKEEAEAQWLKAAAHSPTDMLSRRHLLLLYQQSGNLEKASEMLQQLGKIDPSDATTQLNLGVVSMQLKRFDEAEAAFANVKELLPERPEGYVALARVYLMTNRKNREAVELVEAAVELAPSAANYALLSAACNRNGNLAGARSAIEKAIQLDANNQDFRRIRDSLGEEK